MPTYTIQQIQAALNNPNEFPPRVLADMLRQGCFTVEQLKENGLNTHQANLLQRARDAEMEIEVYQKCCMPTVTFNDLENFINKYPNSPYYPQVKAKYDAWLVEKSLVEGLKGRIVDLEFEQKMREIDKFIEDNPFNHFIDDLKTHKQQLQEEQEKLAAAVAAAAAAAEQERLRAEAEAAQAAEQARIEAQRNALDENAWTNVLRILAADCALEHKLNRLDEYALHYTNHLGEIPEKKQEIIADQEAMPRITSVFNDPKSDVIDFIRLIQKYPQKKKYICDFMLKDMRINPSRYDREEMCWLVKGKYDNLDSIDPVFTSDELIASGVVTYEILNYVLNHPNDPQDDKDLEEDALEPEANFKSMENNTDVYFFGVPGSGKTSVLAGLLKVGICDNLRLKLPMRGEHIGFKYATILRGYLERNLFPQRTKTRVVSRQRLGEELTMQNDSMSVMGDSMDSEIKQGEEYGDKFIQIIDAELIEQTSSGKEESHLLSIIEMPGERTLDFAAAPVKDVNKLDVLLGKGAKELFFNNNRKLFFIVLDPSPEKTFKVTINGGDTYITQQEALEALIEFFDKVPGLLEKVDAIHLILTKSDMLKNPGSKECIMNDVIEKGYEGVIKDIKKLCSISRSNINAQCDHTPYIFTFSLGHVYPGHMNKYNREDAAKILKVIAANTYSTCDSPSQWDSIVEWMNK